MAYLTGLRRPDPELVPHFLGIGFRKAGTTWLHENLHRHPSVYVEARKGVRYFDLRFHDPLATYFEHFREGRDRVRGEVTPNYALIPPRRIRFVRAVMPDVRLLVLLRNPVEQEWARVVHDLRKEGLEPREQSLETILTHVARSRVLRAGGFQAVLNRWYRAFPERQIHVGLFDDIARRPQQLLTEVFEHLGITTDVDWASFPYRDVIVPRFLPGMREGGDGTGVSVPGYQASSRFFPEVVRTYLRERYDDDLRAFHVRFGERVAHWDAPGDGRAAPRVSEPPR